MQAPCVRLLPRPTMCACKSTRPEVRGAGLGPAFLVTSRRGKNTLKQTNHWLSIDESDYVVQILHSQQNQSCIRGVCLHTSGFKFAISEMNPRSRKNAGGGSRPTPWRRALFKFQQIMKPSGM